MIWLCISIICLMWIMVWIALHAKMFEESIKYRCAVKGMPLWTVFVPIVILAIAMTLFINQYM